MLCQNSLIMWHVQAFILAYCTKHVIPLKFFPGQCYDGAAAMKGEKGGLKTKILKDFNPKALYVHCYGHALNLAVQDTIKQVKLVKDMLDTTYQLTKLIKKSP